jgi:hypothetical protein
MSLVKEGRCIVCDDASCGAVSSLPVALRPSRHPAANHNALAAGWLFILSPKGTLHFCPECGRKYLDADHDLELPVRQPLER